MDVIAFENKISTQKAFILKKIKHLIKKKFGFK